MSKHLLKPLFLDDYKIHTKIIPKLKILCKNDISNILIYGPKGSGKLTLIKCLINTYYKESILEHNVSIKINNIELIFKSSDYYFEITLNSYFNKKNFEELLKYLCSNGDINKKCKFKLIIIKNIEYIDFEALKSLKHIVEKKYNYIRFILLTSSLSSITNFFKGFFLLLRLPYADKIELSSYIELLYPSLSKKKITSVIKKTSNLNIIFIKLKINSINNYIDPFELNSSTLIKLIETKKCSNIIKIRDILYDLMSKNYDIKYIFKHIFNELLYNNKIKNKIQIIEIFNNYNNNSFKNIIHLESLLINLMNII